MSQGDPNATLLYRITGALFALSEDFARDFTLCRWEVSVHEADPKVTDLSHAAALKYCVDRARDSLAPQIIEEAVQERLVNQKNALVPRIAPTGERALGGIIQVGGRPVAGLRRGTLEAASGQ